MPPRLTDLYEPGDLVEVHFQDALVDDWYQARVVGHQPPGVWVQASDGSLWFVTNTRRIRPYSPPPSQA